MAVDFYGRTVYNSANDSADSLQRRLNIIDDMGQQQNQFAADKAERDSQARQAAINLRLQKAATEGINQGTQNMQSMQNTGDTSIRSNNKSAGNSFEAFKNAIGQQESGGNYSSVNKGSGAMGKYQIMPSNIVGNKTGWDYQALGYDVTPSQFISSPQLQEKVASKFLQGYYQKYGPAGAAVAWYAGPSAAQKYASSGKAGTNGQAGGNPSVSSYIQDILNKMGL